MTPSGEGRHCARCASTVVDLTRVTRSQAERIVREHGGSVCGRIQADARGHAVFAPEPTRAGALPLALAGLLAACSAEPTSSEVQDDAPAEHDTQQDAVSPTVAITSGTTGSFGGSLATGVMMPLAPPATGVPVLVLPPPTRPPLSVEELADERTEEQRELTRRKHQRHHPLVSTPHTHPLMGAIRLDH